LAKTPTLLQRNQRKCRIFFCAFGDNNKHFSAHSAKTPKLFDVFYKNAKHFRQNAKYSPQTDKIKACLAKTFKEYQCEYVEKVSALSAKTGTNFQRL